MAQLDFGNRLAIYGYKHETWEFDELLAKTWWEQFEPTYSTVEMMLHHPTKALYYTHLIRSMAGVPDMPDYEILRRLTNLRKNKFLAKREVTCAGTIPWTKVEGSKKAAPSLKETLDEGT